MAADLKVGHLSLLGHNKLVSLERHAEEAAHIVGFVAEVGVYKGGSARLLCLTLPDKEVMLFDTFAGMPFQGEGDIHPVGDFGDTSLEAVQSLLSDCANARFCVGLFPETAAAFANRTFALVHVDGDQYQTTRDALEFFYPRMSPGGIMVFDDFDWPHCPGVRKALEEFLSDKPEELTRPHEFQAALRISRVST